MHWKALLLILSLKKFNFVLSELEPATEESNIGFDAISESLVNSSAGTQYQSSSVEDSADETLSDQSSFISGILDESLDVYLTSPTVESSAEKKNDGVEVPSNSSIESNTTRSEQTHQTETSKGTLRTSTLTPATTLFTSQKETSSSSIVSVSTLVSNSANTSNSSNYNQTLIEQSDLENYQIDSNTHFLSFEEWKAQKGVGSEKENEPSVPLRSNQPIAPRDNGVIGEELEIDLSNFFATGGDQEDDHEEEKELNYKKFNYASFDCAATIIKTNPEAKGITSILFENKDSYLLNPCSAPAKFVIIELCQDILVDSLVLANLEFFSSTFKKFTVSVSDSYPVQKAGWIDLGTFSAQDIRDYQTFDIESPRIWAKYVKVDVLEHYGNEFYCPLTVVRVHGRTMMQEYKQEENLQKIQQDEKVKVELQEIVEEILSEAETHDSINSTSESNISKECEVEEECYEKPIYSDISSLDNFSKDFNVDIIASISSLTEINECSLPTLKFDELFHKNNQCSIGDTSIKNTNLTNSTTQSHVQPSQSPQNSGTQESIYKNIMKRLSLLESNATLSVLYIEEQSKLLSTAFTNLEKKHANNLNRLIDTFNSTVNDQIQSLTSLYHVLQQETKSIFNNQRSNHEQLLSDAYFQIDQLSSELRLQKFLGIINFLIICGILIYVVLTRDTYIDTEYNESSLSTELTKRRITSTGSRIKANFKRYYASTNTSGNENSDDEIKTISTTIDKLKKGNDDKGKSDDRENVSDFEYEQPPTPAYSDGE